MAWPDGFLWGTGASSTQCEGATLDDGEMATLKADDFRTYADLGLRHHRLSIE